MSAFSWDWDSFHFGIGEQITHPMRSEMERGKIAGSSVTIESNPCDPNSLGTAGAFQNERFLAIGGGYLCLRSGSTFSPLLESG
jgi:hypothetical protein